MPILFLFLIISVVGKAQTSSGKMDVYKSLTGKNIDDLYSLGMKYEKTGEKAKALTFYNALVSKYSDDLSKEEKKKCAEAFSRSGDIYYRSRQYSSAMNQYLSGLRVSELNSFGFITAQIYIGIGNIYSSHDDYEMGIHYYKQALLLVDNPKGKSIKNKVLNNLVGASCFAGRASDGEKYLRMLLNSRESTTDYEFNLLMCNGLVASYKGNMLLSIQFYNKALRYVEKEKLSEAYYESVSSCLAQIYLEINQPDSAISYLRKNEEIAKRIHQIDLLEETMRSLSEAYEKKGNHTEAMAYKMRYVDLSDSLYNNTEFNAIKNAMFQYEASKSENAILSLTQEKKDRDKLITMQRGWIVTLVVAFIVFVIMLVVLYRQKKQLFQAYHELFNRSQQYITDRNGVEEVSSKESAPSDTGKILSEEQHNAILSNIVRVMESTDDFCQSDFSIDTLASLVGTNSRYVSEAINEGFDKNFRTFLNEYRIKEAMRRLADIEHYGGYTIKAISESVGYKSQANFISVFTKVTGMKPSIYQKISKEKRNSSL